MKTVFMKPSGNGLADQLRKLDGSFWKVVLVFFKGQGFRDFSSLGLLPPCFENFMQFSCIGLGQQLSGR